MAPLFSAEFAGSIDSTATDEEWRLFFADVFGTSSDFLCQERRRREGDFPDFAIDAADQTDLVIKDVRNHQVAWELAGRDGLPVRVIYLARDPRATIWSWMSNPHEFPSGGRDDDWRTGGARKLGGEGEFWGFNDWLDVTRKYVDLARAHPNRIEVVRFEELCEGGPSAFAALFERLDLSFGEECVGFLEASWNKVSDRPYSVYRDRWSVLRPWQGRLAGEIESAIVEETIECGLDGFLYNQ